MPAWKRVYNWHISLVAAGCMVLMSYDASVFNAAQISPNWLEYFDHPLRGLLISSVTIVGIISGFLLDQWPTFSVYLFFYMVK
ncbi:cf4ba2df-35ad-4959-9b20-17687ac008be [Thermothielavioides terrestris]|uniref:Uncharacterized protein n=2 Tax=Thermothielavioides terrestris TaxID=2587410 RepID=G2QWW1_THETT|nr:uncharacterized protein THITE_2084640 [Thermothielavioides terrestris NRRL 8126]AEO63125.1 hypothetical protein THITE_2084640 [Thermothielavioides terrestris NRRL 8126]SPQ21381.1 cf4ba2df-35ad-4959-9b20-17687ac008be [Thermothielavioides terrestris]